MGTSRYIDRICRELSSRPSKQAEEQTKALIGIFELVQGLPSPQKEETFVDLLLELSPSNQVPVARPDVARPAVSAR